MARTKTSWVKGQSGNTAGMPRGTERKVTRIVRQLSERATPEIAEGIIRDALQGDAQARALFVKYLMPAKPKYIPTPIKLPVASSGAQALEQIALLIAGLAGGRIDLEAGHLVLEGLRAYLAGVPTAELEAKFREFRLLMLQWQDKKP
jgi:hypothetical protein